MPVFVADASHSHGGTMGSEMETMEPKCSETCAGKLKSLIMNFAE